VLRTVCRGINFWRVGAVTYGKSFARSKNEHGVEVAPAGGAPRGVLRAAVPWKYHTVSFSGETFSEVRKEFTEIVLGHPSRITTPLLRNDVVREGSDPVTSDPADSFVRRVRGDHCQEQGAIADFLCAISKISSRSKHSRSALVFCEGAFDEVSSHGHE